MAYNTSSRRLAVPCHHRQPVPRRSQRDIGPPLVITPHCSTLLCPILATGLHMAEIRPRHCPTLSRLDRTIPHPLRHSDPWQGKEGEERTDVTTQNSACTEWIRTIKSLPHHRAVDLGGQSTTTGSSLTPAAAFVALDVVGLLPLDTGMPPPSMVLTKGSRGCATFESTTSCRLSTAAPNPRSICHRERNAPSPLSLWPP
jgi:hypothetical protein